MEPLEPRILMAFNPTGLEQELFQLINRFRADPQGELTRILSSASPPSSSNALIQSQLDYWGVRGDLLRSQWANLTPVPPLAWSEPLYNAAQSHNQAMFRHDRQQHKLPGELSPGARLTAEGYDWALWGENIYAFPRSIAEAHAGFVINWGPGQGGIQSPPGHRLRLLRDDYVHVGVAVSQVGTSPGRQVGPLLVTQDFAAPLEATPAYVVGAVFKASGGSPFYKAGSGYGAVQIVFEGAAGTFTTTSMGAGGYQLQLPPGTYRVRAEGGKLPAPLMKEGIVVGDRNVAVDLIYPADRAWAPQAADDIYVLPLGVSASLAVLDNDGDRDGVLVPASVTIVAGPAAGLVQVDPVTGQVEYQPDDLWVGADTFSYQVRDNDGFVSNTAVVRVIVIDPLDRPWQNPDDMLDVNADGLVTPGDALLVVNALATGRGGELPVPPLALENPPMLWDVTGDNILSARDALMIINYLNDPEAAEGERPRGRVREPVPSAVVELPEPLPLDGLVPRPPASAADAPAEGTRVERRAVDERDELWPTSPGLPATVALPSDEDELHTLVARSPAHSALDDALADRVRDACFQAWPWLDPLIELIG